MGKIIGIDLGTTNSAVAVWDANEPRLIVSERGARLTPSVVGFGPDDQVLVGEAARHQAGTNASNTIYSAKRFIGRPFDAVAEDREAVPYEVVAGDNGQAQFLIGDVHWTPEAISALVLGELKKLAEASLGDPVAGAVITVPAHFNDTQRAATREAGRLAGLDVRRILNEPTAAALAYGLDKMIDGERIVAVYDFGGGTFDVSILSVGEDIIEVIATRGDSHVGGDMIDTRVAAWFLEHYETAAGAKVDEDAETHQHLREAAEEAKIGLSTKDSVTIHLPFPDEDPAKSQLLEVSIARSTFEEMIGDLVERTLACCAQVLADAGKEPGEIDEIVLAGGSTRIPLVRQRVAAYFGKQPQTTINPDEVVAMGAAVQAGILNGDVKGVVLVDVTSLSLGIETHDGRTIVVSPRNTTLPATASFLFTTSVDDQIAVQFHVVQGEAELANLNSSLGRFILDGLKPARAGTPQIEVTFAIDINGMVLVSAHDRETGSVQTVKVSASLAAAPQRAPAATPTPDADRKVSAVAPPKVEVPSDALATLKEADQMLREAGEKLTRVDRASLMKHVNHLRKLATASANVDEVERARAAVSKVITRVKNSRVPRRRV